MAKEKPNKWTRERGFLEVNANDILVWAVSLIFLTLTVGGFFVIIVQPHIPGLSELFSDPPPPRYTGTPPDQKLHLAPGETEMKLYAVPAKKPDQPKEPPKK